MSVLYLQHLCAAPKRPKTSVNQSKLKINLTPAEILFQLNYVSTCRSDVKVSVYCDIRLLLYVVTGAQATSALSCTGMWRVLKHRQTTSYTHLLYTLPSPTKWFVFGSWITPTHSYSKVYCDFLHFKAKCFNKLLGEETHVSYQDNSLLA